MRTLFISPRQCWPVRSGAKLREYHFARALARTGELTYVHFTEPGSQPLSTNDLPFCHRVIGIPKPAAYTPLNLLKGVLTSSPVTILNYASEQMMQTVRDLTAATIFDVIHFDIIHVMAYLQAVQRPPRATIFNWHNIESEAMERYSETVHSVPRRWYARTTAAKLRLQESRILHQATGHVVCSERERALLLAQAPQARIEVVENGVDVPYFQGSGTTALSDAPTLLFVGSMDYFPNQDASIWFAQRIWPRIREKFPTLRLTLVGSNPPESVTRLGQIPGVTVTGTVPDVRSYYGDALAAVVPLRTGSGTRLKILEAFSAGVPVISSPLGAEGLDLVCGRDFLLADPEQVDPWLDHIGTLLRSPSRRTELTNSAFQVVRQRYDWETLGRKLVDAYQSWI